MKNLLKDYKNYYLYLRTGEMEFQEYDKLTIVSEDEVFIEVSYSCEDDDGSEIREIGLIAKATINQICKLEPVKKANKKSEADF